MSAARVCKGETCSRSLAGRRANAVWCDKRCKEKHRRMDIKREALAAGLPATLSRATVRAAGSTGKGLRAPQKAGSAPRKARPSDVRLSYLRVLSLLSAHLGDERAVELLDDLLTPRQRQLQGKARRAAR